MKTGRFLLWFLLLSILPCVAAYPQEAGVHRNIGLDSLMVLMQNNSSKKIYYQGGGEDSKQVFTVLNFLLNIHPQQQHLSN